MGWFPRRVEREWRTVSAMVAIYCRAHHGAERLCEVCRQLLEHARRRLERCPFGPGKPTCRRCPIHCYAPGPREMMRAVMAFAGPRMLRRHPVLALLHLLDDRSPVPGVRERASPRAVRVEGSERGVYCDSVAGGGVDDVGTKDGGDSGDHARRSGPGGLPG